MFNLPRFFYEDGSNEGGSGPDNNADTQQQQPVNTNVNVLNPLFSEQELKEFGFDSADQLKDHLRQTKESRVPDDVKKKAAEVEKADFLKVSAEEGLLNVEEYTAYEAITKKSDSDIVYENFSTQYKEDNPEATDELIRQEFNKEYKLDSENPKVKSRGEARLKKEADEVRSPLTGKYNSAKEFHTNYQTTRKEEPAFTKFIDDLVQELTPESLVLAKAKDDTKDDESEIEIPATITKEQRAEIAKLFKNPKYFAAYLDNKDKLKDTLAPSLTKKINSIIKENNFDNAVTYAFKQGKGIGRKSGSNVGAEQPFSVVKNNPKRVEVTPSAQQELDNSDKAMRSKYAR
jgi:hypothetical protein